MKNSSSSSSVKNQQAPTTTPTTSSEASVKEIVKEIESSLWEEYDDAEQNLPNVIRTVKLDFFKKIFTAFHSTHEHYKIPAVPYFDAFSMVTGEGKLEDAVFNALIGNGSPLYNKVISLCKNDLSTLLPQVKAALVDKMLTKYYSPLGEGIAMLRHEIFIGAEIDRNKDILPHEDTLRTHLESLPQLSQPANITFIYKEEIKRIEDKIEQVLQDIIKQPRGIVLSSLPHHITNCLETYHRNMLSFIDVSKERQRDEAEIDTLDLMVTRSTSSKPTKLRRHFAQSQTQLTSDTNNLKYTPPTDFNEGTKKLIIESLSNFKGNKTEKDLVLHKLSPWLPKTTNAKLKTMIVEGLFPSFEKLKHINDKLFKEEIKVILRQEEGGLFTREEIPLRIASITSNYLNRSIHIHKHFSERTDLFTEKQPIINERFDLIPPSFKIREDCRDNTTTNKTKAYLDFLKKDISKPDSTSLLSTVMDLLTTAVQPPKLERSKNHLRQKSRAERKREKGDTDVSPIPSPRETSEASPESSSSTSSGEKGDQPPHSPRPQLLRRSGNFGRYASEITLPSVPSSGPHLSAPSLLENTKLRLSRKSGQRLLPTMSDVSLPVPTDPYGTNLSAQNENRETESPDSSSVSTKNQTAVSLQPPARPVSPLPSIKEKNPYSYAKNSVLEKIRRKKEASTIQADAAPRAQAIATDSSLAESPDPSFSNNPLRPQRPRAVSHGDLTTLNQTREKPSEAFAPRRGKSFSSIEKSKDFRQNVRERNQKEVEQQGVHK